MPPVQNPGFLQPGSPGHSYFSVPLSFGVFGARHRNTSENNPGLGCHFSAFSLGSRVVCFPCGSVVKNAPAYVDGSRDDIDANGYKKWGVDGDSRANFLVDQPQVLEFRVPDSSYLQFQAPVTISKAAGKVPLSDCICIRLYFIIALKLLAYNPIT